MNSRTAVQQGDKLYQMPIIPLK